MDRAFARNPYLPPFELTKHDLQVLLFGKSTKFPFPCDYRSLNMPSRYADDRDPSGYSDNGGRESHVSEINLSPLKGPDDGRAGTEQHPLDPHAELLVNSTLCHEQDSGMVEGREVADPDHDFPNPDNSP